MTIANMQKIQLIGHKSRLEELSYDILESASIQLKKSHTISSVSKIKNYIEPVEIENSYQSVINKAEAIADNLNIDFQYSQKIDLKKLNKINFDDIKRELNPIYKEVNKWLEYKEELEERKKYLLDIKKHVNLLKNLDIKLEKLSDLSYISLVFGRVYLDDYERLIENIVNIPVLVLEVNRNDEYVWFFTFAKKENEEKALNFLNSIHFDRYQLPANIEGAPEQILQDVNFKLENIKLSFAYLEIQFNRIRQEYKSTLKKLFSRLKLLDSIREVANEYYGGTKYLFFLEGWIPSSWQNEFIDKIEKDYQDIIYTIEKTTEEETPPTLLQNKLWFKPFEKLTLLYDVPQYGELDPSLFMAITYLIMFGFMFGDVGQGLVFLLGGIAIYKNYIKFISSDNGLFLAYLGMSSIVFGFLYGSLFGMEDLLPAIWLQPMDNIIYLLKITIGLGIFFMLSSMVFNVINSFKNDNLKEGLFARSGLSGIFFYIISLISVYYIFTEGELFFQTGLTSFLLFFPLILILFKEPLGNILERKEKIWPDNKGQYLVVSLFELFETILGFFSNTISFVRIGAFTLNHIALFMAVFTLAKMLKGFPGGNLWSILLIISGNIIILLLEGLVVGIQVLRLEYYELFSKFYRGGGNKFSPVKLE